MDNGVYDILKEEVFFENATEEYDYFNRRMTAISHYSNQFFKDQAIADLTKRYVKGLAAITDTYENDSIIECYKDCLIQLGMDDYCIDSEVANYKETHTTKNKDAYVSHNGK